MSARMTDDELMRAAEALHAERQRSVGRLRARVGGGDTGRLMRVTRTVRESAKTSASGALLRGAPALSTRQRSDPLRCPAHDRPERQLQPQPCRPRGVQ